jgi:hypothetical protein
VLLPLRRSRGVLLWEGEKIEQPKLARRKVEDEDLPPTPPDIRDEQTIRLVREGINLLRGGQPLMTPDRRAKIDNALAIFDRALADLLNRLENERGRGWRY